MTTSSSRSVTGLFFLTRTTGWSWEGRPGRVETEANGTQHACSVLQKSEFSLNPRQPCHSSGTASTQSSLDGTLKEFTRLSLESIFSIRESRERMRVGTRERQQPTKQGDQEETKDVRNLVVWTTCGTKSLGLMFWFHSLPPPSPPSTTGPLKGAVHSTRASTLIQQRGVPRWFRWLQGLRSGFRKDINSKVLHSITSCEWQQQWTTNPVP